MTVDDLLAKYIDMLNADATSKELSEFLNGPECLGPLDPEEYLQLQSLAMTARRVKQEYHLSELVRLSEEMGLYDKDKL